MSSTRRRISGAVGSTTGRAGSSHPIPHQTTFRGLGRGPERPIPRVRMGRADGRAPALRDLVLERVDEIHRHRIHRADPAYGAVGHLGIARRGRRRRELVEQSAEIVARRFFLIRRNGRLVGFLHRPRRRCWFGEHRLGRCLVGRGFGLWRCRRGLGQGRVRRRLRRRELGLALHRRRDICLGRDGDEIDRHDGRRFVDDVELPLPGEQRAGGDQAVQQQRAEYAHARSARRGRTVPTDSQASALRHR